MDLNGVPKHFRPETNDADIWRHTFFLNEYRLPDSLAGQTVLDVGGHIGSFSALALVRGAAKIYVFEPFLGSYKLLVNNLKDHLDKVVPVNAAVWRSDEGSGFLEIEAPGFNSGGNSVFRTDGPVYQECLAVPMDDVLVDIGTVDLLKIDVEGAEFPILLTSKQLGRVKRIHGEFHGMKSIPDIAQVAHYCSYSMETLRYKLSKEGFNVTSWPDKAEMGLFIAERA